MDGNKLRALWANSLDADGIQELHEAMDEHVGVFCDALDDRDRLGWIISESDHGNTSLLDDLWEIASKLCPLNYKEAEDIQKWLRAAIDARRSAK